MDNIKLKQIAYALNLSTSTVSRALSDSHQISEKTKKIVLEYASEKKYTVNRFAKGLREGKTRTIGVVICSINSAFMTQAVDGIYELCKKNDYHFLIMQSKGSFEEEKACVSMLLDSQIDGLLISPSFNSIDLTYLSDLQQNGLPIVLFDRICSQVNTPQVAVDNYNSAYFAAKHLINKGINRVVIINCINEVLLGTERVNGFIQAFKNEIKMDYDCIIENHDQTNILQLQLELENSFRKIFIEEKSAEAIFTTTDSFTMAALKVLHKLNIVVPIIGFSNSELGEILIGKPAVIFQPAYELGMVACGQLLALINNNEDGYKVTYLPTKLIVEDV